MKNIFKIIIVSIFFFLPSGMALASEISGVTPLGGVIISTPIPSSPSGRYSSAQNIMLSAPYSDSIHYTLDGDIPSCISGIVYKDPIIVNNSKTIKAISCYEKGKQSEVSIFSYEIRSVVGSFRSSPPSTSNTPAVPEVLGASTEAYLDACYPYLNGYIVYGRKNDAQNVKKLQLFLNFEMGSKLPITGYFGPMTSAEVKKFQEKYRDAILGKGYIGKGTGNVYQMTMKHIDKIECAKKESGDSKLKIN